MSVLGLFSIFLCYLLGAIPFGLLLSRKSGVDIRKAGSGNIGATNVARLLGKKMGAITLLCDMAKGFLPIFTLHLLHAEPLVLALAGAATVLGHMYPVYLKFRGGKGVATALGLFLFLAPYAVALALLLFLAVVRFSGFVSAGSLAAAASLPILLAFMHKPGWQLALAVFVAAMIWLKHKDNIKRLLSGTEKTWKKTA